MTCQDVRPSLEADKVRDGRGEDHEVSVTDDRPSLDADKELSVTDVRPTFTGGRQSARWAGRGP